MSWLYLLSCWLHVMAAVAWLGAAIFLVVALVPALRSPQLGGAARQLLRGVGGQLRWLGAGSLAIFLVTGAYNLHCRFGEALGSAVFWESRIGAVVAGKLALFGVIVVVATIHDLWLGPRAAVAAATDPDSAETARLRRGARLCGRANLVFGLVMVALGVLIVRPGW